MSELENEMLRLN